MIWPYDFGLLLLVVITAILALNLRDLMGASIVFGTYSFLMCLLSGAGGVKRSQEMQTKTREQNIPTTFACLRSFHVMLVMHV